MSVGVRLSSVLLVGSIGARLQAAEPSVAPNEVNFAVEQVFFVHSRSLAYSHLSRTGCEVQWMRRVDERWAWGGSLGATWTVDRNYQVASAQLRGRRRWTYAGTRVGVSAGLGIGRNAPILYADLRANAVVVPVFSLATELRWPLTERGSVGVVASSQQFATVQLGVFAGVEF